MTEAYRIEDYEKLLAKLSHKASRRAAMRGVSLEFDDLFQEAKVTFCIASEKFDPTRNVKFSTYLWNAVRNNLSRLIDNIGSSHRFVSLDDGFEDGGMSFHEVVADEYHEPADERLERMERHNEIFASLSTKSRLVVMALNSPGPMLCKELERMKAFREICIERKMAAAVRVMDVQMVCTALGLTENETRQVKRELKEIMEGHHG